MNSLIIKHTPPHTLCQIIPNNTKPKQEKQMKYEKMDKR